MTDFKTFVRKVLSGRAPWTYGYLFLIPFINWCFDHVPTYPLPGHGDWNPMTVVTGLVLVVRDFAQREVGHYIFGFLAVGLLLSIVTSDPTIAFASACAFAISETIDWALFTFAKLPLSKRVFVSAGISGPIDAAAFLWIASYAIPGIFNIWSLAGSVVSRFLGCLVVYLIMKHRERKLALAAAEPA
ncbi:MAG: VUT family protein [Asticcacaulis sp.]|uniref:VUT family protein n=1 Tax=Asticcacaulis sp. TaxID=1872648 RepID=UPI003F7BABDF